MFLSDSATLEVWADPGDLPDTLRLLYHNPACGGRLGGAHVGPDTAWQMLERFGEGRIAITGLGITEREVTSEEEVLDL